MTVNVPKESLFKTQWNIVVRKDTFVDIEFKRVIEMKGKHVWNIGKMINSTKICHLLQRYDPKPTQSEEKCEIQ